MHPDAPFTALLLITLLALLVPVLASRLPGIRLPIVVGEILAGMVVGQSGLHLITHRPVFARVWFCVLDVSVRSRARRAGALSATRHHESPSLSAPVALALLSFSLTVLLAVGIGVGLVQLGLARNALLVTY